MTPYHIHPTLDRALVPLLDVSSQGKLLLPLYVDGAPSYAMATPGVKKLGYVFATKKRCILQRDQPGVFSTSPGNLPRGPSSAARTNVPSWRDVGCHGPQQSPPWGAGFRHSS